MSLKPITALTGSKHSVTIQDHMDDSTKRAVAYIAGRALSGRSSASLYDRTFSQYFNFSGKVTESAVSTYDYTQRCYISGSGRSGSFSLYHYGDRKHIRLQIDGRRFRGYDHGSGGHFSGSVNGRSVMLYDYSHSTWYYYSI